MPTFPSLRLPATLRVICLSLGNTDRADITHCIAARTSALSPDGAGERGTHEVELLGPCGGAELVENAEPASRPKFSTLCYAHAAPRQP